MSESPLCGPDFGELVRVDPKIVGDREPAAVKDGVVALVSRKPAYSRA